MAVMVEKFHNIVWFGTMGGLVKFDGDTTRTLFTPDNSGLPSNEIFALDFDEEYNLWVGTDKGLAVYEEAGVTVLDQDHTSFPEASTLFQNYPNPLNPTTTIEFSIPQNGWGTLTVYDLLGREVTTLVDSPEGSGSPLRSDWQEAGQHSVEWNASNVPSGIYFVKMKSGAFNRVRKVTVIQ